MEKTAIIKSWLSLLDDHERLVIERRLIKGLDWPRVEAEYRHIYGEKGKCERSLRGIQDAAFRKIERFIHDNAKMHMIMGLPDFLFYSDPK